MVASSEGAGLFFAETERRPRMHFFCASGNDDLLVNVPAFKPVASEERLSLGGDGTAVALVADARGDALRGGVSGVGPVPAELGAILAAPTGPGVSYGAQTAGSGPVAPDLARQFLAACAD